MALSSWVELAGSILVNLDNVSAIEEVSDTKSRIYQVSGSDIVVSVSYNALKEIIKMRRTVEVDKEKSMTRIMRTIGTNTP